MFYSDFKTLLNWVLFKAIFLFMTSMLSLEMKELNEKASK